MYPQPSTPASDPDRNPNSCDSYSPADYLWRATFENATDAWRGQRVCLRLAVDDSLLAKCESSAFGQCCRASLLKIEILASEFVGPLDASLPGCPGCRWLPWLSLAVAAWLPWLRACLIRTFASASGVGNTLPHGPRLTLALTHLRLDLDLDAPAQPRTQPCLACWHCASVSYLPLTGTPVACLRTRPGPPAPPCSRSPDPRCQGSISAFTVSGKPGTFSSFLWNTDYPVLKFTKVNLEYEAGKGPAFLCFNLKGPNCTKLTDLCNAPGACQAATFAPPGEQTAGTACTTYTAISNIDALIARCVTRASARVLCVVHALRGATVVHAVVHAPRHMLYCFPSRA
jgi:hypothetical protein